MKIEEIRFAVMEPEDLDVFLHRVRMLHWSMYELITVQNTQVAPHVYCVGTYEYEGEEIGMYEGRVSNESYSDNKIYSVPNCMAVGFGYRGVIYTMNYEQASALGYSINDTECLDEDVVFIEFMELISDYYPEGE